MRNYVSGRGEILYKKGPSTVGNRHPKCGAGCRVNYGYALLNLNLNLNLTLSD